MTTDTTPPKKRRLGCQIAVLVVLAILLAGGGVAYLLWSAKPAYWKRNEQFLATHDNETLLQMAIALEQRILAAASDPTANGAESEDRPVTMSVDEVNAWLHMKLGTLLANQNLPMPANAGEPMLAIEGDHLVLAFHYKTSRVDQIVSALFMLNIHDDGSATVKLDGSRAGRLPIPVSVAASGVSNAQSNKAKSGAQDVLQSLFGGYNFEPIIPVDSTRQIRLRGYRLTKDGIEATLRSEPKAPKPPRK